MCVSGSQAGHWEAVYLCGEREAVYEGGFVISSHEDTQILFWCSSPGTPPGVYILLPTCSKPGMPPATPLSSNGSILLPTCAGPKTLLTTPLKFKKFFVVVEISCFLSCKISIMTIKWCVGNVSCAQSYPWKESSMIHICPGMAKHKRGILWPHTAQHKRLCQCKHWSKK